MGPIADRRVEPILKNLSQRRRGSGARVRTSRRALPEPFVNALQISVVKVAVISGRVSHG